MKKQPLRSPHVALGRLYELTVDNTIRPTVKQDGRRMQRHPLMTRHLTHTKYRLLSLPFGWLGSRVVSVLDSGAEGPGFKLQWRCCRVTVLGKLFTPTVPLFTKQQNW